MWVAALVISFTMFSDMFPFIYILNKFNYVLHYGLCVTFIDYFCSSTLIMYCCSMRIIFLFFFMLGVHPVYPALYPVAFCVLFLLRHKLIYLQTFVVVFISLSTLSVAWSRSKPLFVLSVVYIMAHLVLHVVGVYILVLKLRKAFGDQISTGQHFRFSFVVSAFPLQRHTLFWTSVYCYSSLS